MFWPSKRSQSLDVNRTYIILPEFAPLEPIGTTPLRVGECALALSPDGSNLVYVADRHDGLEIIQIEGFHKGRDTTTVQVPETADYLRVKLLVLVVLFSLLTLRRGKQQKARKTR